MKNRISYIILVISIFIIGCDQSSKKPDIQTKSEGVQWVSGFGQGTMEYFVGNGLGNKILISCNMERPASVTVELMGKEVDKKIGEKTTFIIDSIPYIDDHENRDCNVCYSNFESFWENLRNAKTLAVSFSDKKISSFSTNKLKEILPPLTVDPFNDENSTCTVNRDY
jgi:hypothetical protein